MEAPAGLSARPRATWRWWEAIPVFATSFLAAGLVVAGAFAFVPEGGWRDVAVLVIFPLALAATVALWFRGLHRSSWRALGLPDRPVRDLAWGAVGGAAIYMVATMVGALVSGLIERTAGRAPDVEQLPEALSGPQWAVAGFAAIVLAPVAEELFFRGLLFGALRGRMPFLPAAAISAVVFAATHFQPDAFSYLLLASVILVVGLGLALIYERRGSLLAPILAHALFNAVGFAFLVGG
ncbi:MAG: CPBP family intramembrane metalloprotease [Actinobacteria bacterium]|nr:CPBP family intramembrane metalloprotease [Actinomycetota bacterium]